MAKLKRMPVVVGLAASSVIALALAGAFLKTAEKAETTPPATETTRLDEALEIAPEIDRTILVEDLSIDSLAAVAFVIEKPYRVVPLPVVMLSGVGDTERARRLEDEIARLLSERDDIILLERSDQLDDLIDEWALDLTLSGAALPRVLRTADYLLAPSVFLAENGRAAIFLKFISVRSTLVASSTYGEAHQGDMPTLLPALIDKLMNGTLNEPIVANEGRIESTPEMAAAYQQALGLFRQNEIYDAAGLFLKVSHGGSDYAADAQYWLGRCYAKMNRPRDAVLAWEAYRRGYPSGRQNAAIRAELAEQRRLAGR